MQRGGAELIVTGGTAASIIKNQEAGNIAQNRQNLLLKGGGRRIRQKGGSCAGGCNNDYVDCPPVGMVGPIAQMPNALDNKLIINAARIQSQAAANAIYDKPATS